MLSATCLAVTVEVSYVRHATTRRASYTEYSRHVSYSTNAEMFRRVVDKVTPIYVQCHTGPSATVLVLRVTFVSMAKFGLRFQRI